MPESLRAFFRMVSFTAPKTSLIFVVLVACVKLRRREWWTKYWKNIPTVDKHSDLPGSPAQIYVEYILRLYWYLGRQYTQGNTSLWVPVKSINLSAWMPPGTTVLHTLGSLFLNTSTLFKSKMIDVCLNQQEFTTASKRINDSAMRFCWQDQVATHSGITMTYLILVL